MIGLGKRPKPCTIGPTPMKVLSRLFARPFPAALLAVALIGFATGCRRGSTSAAPNPDAVAAVNRGVSLMGQYDYDGAARAFEQALAASPDLAPVQINLAIARFNRGKKENHDVEEATRLLDAVLQRHPDDPRALYFKAIILQHLGQTDAAVAGLQKVVQLRPDDGVAWYVLGLCQQRLGQDPQPALLRAVALRPYLASAYYRLWQTLQAAGKSTEAAPYLEKFKALRESPLAETIELPQYNQMGDLALVVPLDGVTPPPAPVASYRADPARELASGVATTVPAAPFSGAAFVEAKQGELPLILPNGGFAPAPVAGLSAIDTPAVWAVGDYDNDGQPDLFVVDRTGHHLLHRDADGTFTPASAALAAPAAGGRTIGALWLDADHDGDLDLLLSNVGAPNQLFQNNADGTFTEIAATAGFAETAGDSVAMLPGDLDGDRDTDLVLLRAGAPAKIFLNDLAGRFRELPGDPAMRGELGGVLQDFNGDGLLDLLVLGGEPPQLRLFLGDGHAHFKPAAPLLTAGDAALSAGLRAFRIADVDLDGDLDIAIFSREGHLLLNDGSGHFKLQPRVWTPSPGSEIAGAELTDLTGDFVPDLLLLEHGARDRVLLMPGALSSHSTALAIAPTGVRTRDKRTRSPASGYGVLVTARAGTREQALLCSGQSGGPNQSPRPLVFGLRGAPQADYTRLLWTDAVAQVETALPAGQAHAITETQRKISSCPILFTWNGSRFEFITDFAGVGGLGYYVGPGEYAAPQPLDTVKIEASQLQPRNGRYELRIAEAMEESAYVDRLELLAIDHPAGWAVYPDERLAVTGPAPTHELLAVEKPIHAQHATAPGGADCTAALLHADRHYAYEPPLDRRFFGFCAPHTLELDFGDQLAAIPASSRLCLVITGYLEYPYSQTTYAAGQARVGWEPIRIERQRPDGSWETIVADAGALSGMSRSMTVDLTGLVPGAGCRLRLTTNLEIYYDEIFLGAIVPSDRVQVHALPVAAAELRPLGFAQEVSPDGHYPLVYDYARLEPTAPFQTLRGAYTRYGDVRELLTGFDDQFALIAPGDEIAATFDATALPPTPAGHVRSFVLVSHAWCKDMDLYTATPQTLEPMPFRGMTRYPYPAHERPPETEAQHRIRQTYQTRVIE